MRHLTYIFRLPNQRFCSPFILPIKYDQELLKHHSKFQRINPATSTRCYGGGQNPKSDQTAIKLWPFAAITILGTGIYFSMVKSRTVETEMPPSDDQTKINTTFSPSKVTVIYVLGGPGAGKGTHCSNLVRDYNFTHLSAGDVLRDEQNREGSEFGSLIKTHIKEGTIVPMEITIRLLEKAMVEIVNKDPDGRGKFLIDGFPRKMDQAIKFEQTVCRGKFVLFLDCPEEEMQRRLLNRGRTSGRDDDNLESIMKRFKTFKETSMPVVEYFEGQARVVKVKSVGSPKSVYEEIRTNFEQKLGKNF